MEVLDGVLSLQGTSDYIKYNRCLWIGSVTIERLGLQLGVPSWLPPMSDPWWQIDILDPEDPV